MKIEVYGRVEPYCQFCESTKALLERHDQPYVFKDIVANPDYRTELLERAPTARTVPQVFVDGELIGGASAFEAYWSTI